MTAEEYNKKDKERQDGIDRAILNLKTQLEESGLQGDTLTLAVAKVYANSCLIAFQNKHIKPKI
jgi:CII-binding regulator of phage lambda lysogenization HflD